MNKVDPKIDLSAASVDIIFFLVVFTEKEINSKCFSYYHSKFHFGDRVVAEFHFLHYRTIFLIHKVRLL